jgi:uncharacterized membrane protein
MFAILVPGLVLWFQAGMFDWIMGLMEDYPFTGSLPDITESVDMALFSLGVFLMLLGALVIGILFIWALNLVWFFDIGPLEALAASRKLIARNWVSVVIFLILAGLIGLSGVLLCGVGIFYTAPAMAVAQFFAFADSSKILEDDETDQQPDIIDHFIA